MDMGVSNRLARRLPIIDSDIEPIGPQVRDQYAPHPTTSRQTGACPSSDRSNRLVTCRLGMTKVWPSVTGNASGTAIAASFSRHTRVVSRLQNGQVDNIAGLVGVGADARQYTPTDVDCQAGAS